MKFGIGDPVRRGMKNEKRRVLRRKWGEIPFGRVTDSSREKAGEGAKNQSVPKPDPVLGVSSTKLPTEGARVQGLFSEKSVNGTGRLSESVPTCVLRSFQPPAS
jgi:hypothetical protein